MDCLIDTATMTMADFLPQDRERSAHCDKHGPYRSRPLFGSIWSRCPACSRIEAEREREQQQLEEQTQRQQRLERRIGQSGIPLRFLDRTLDNYRVEHDGQRRALIFARAYADGFADALKTGRSAVFVGRPGTGKNHLAAGICQRVMADGHTALFLTVIKALRRVKDTWRRGSTERESEAIATLTRPDLLVLDEVGVQFDSKAEQLILFDVINERYESRRPTLLLSNLPPAEVQRFLGERIWDRLREDGGKVIVFGWESDRDRCAAEHG